MKRLRDFKDEEALDLLAELFDPAVSILVDENFRLAIDSGNRASAVKIALKDHKHAVMKILAAMDGVNVNSYHCNIFTLPIRIGEVINEVMEEPELMTFFTSSSEKTREMPSGSTTESTEVKEA